MSKFDPNSTVDWLNSYGKKTKGKGVAKTEGEADELDWFSASGYTRPPSDLEELFSIYYTKSTDSDGNGIPINVKFPVWEYNAIMAFAHHNPKYKVGQRVSIAAVIRNAVHKLVYWEAEHLRNPDAARLFNKYESDRAITDRARRAEEVDRAREYLDDFINEKIRWIKEDQPYMAMRMLLQANKLQMAWRQDGINFWGELKEKFIDARNQFHDKWGEEWFENELLEILQTEEPNL